MSHAGTGKMLGRDTANGPVKPRHPCRPPMRRGDHVCSAIFGLSLIGFGLLALSGSRSISAEYPACIPAGFQAKDGQTTLKGMEMKRIVALLLSGVLLASCSEMKDYYPDAQTVEIDGRSFFVVARPANGAGVYLAGPNEPGLNEVLLSSDMTLPVANVAAIEKVTGCPVLRETIQNQQVGTTFAAVRCS
ncbi:hypothetical protein HW561_09540 [Rhodobacteraceae bacterium B1Z28]|uniref:Lipoprotein n=1 Tax=Ruegeria haliotis TaxID=2747601 RepID=A0ABX2PSI7_9RHOB|nr:hypothetical protein [Ruegeria haliotis]NVO56029.1 hypothetical protein [Ruegeria haliotis]